MRRELGHYPDGMGKPYPVLDGFSDGLAQIWPEYSSKYAGRCRFDENGNFREDMGNGGTVLSGAAIMGQINTAGAWSDRLPTCEEIIQRAGAIV